MAHVTYNKKILTSRDFFRSPVRVGKIIERGEHIVVTKHGQKVFEVVPAQQCTGKTIADFADLQFSAPDQNPDLSVRVDEIAYGS